MGEAPVCNITWNALSLRDWEEYFRQCRRAPLLQDYDYARGICAVQNMRARWGLIEIDGVPAGLVQILEAGFLKNMVHALILDRGPVWLAGYGTPDHFEAFLHEFTRQFPARFGRKRRFIPEYNESECVRRALLQAGFKRQGDHPYQTSWLDLTQDEDELRAGLKKNWRNMVSKAERTALSLEWDDKGAHWLWMVGVYAADKKGKAYKGASLPLLKQLASHFLPKGKMVIARIIKEGRPVAGALFFLHGSCATYQIGWTGQAGRDCGAQHYLLWECCKMLKQKGLKDLDLGGFDETHSKGLATFKAGMGGDPVTLPGIYV